MTFRPSSLLACGAFALCLALALPAQGIAVKAVLPDPTGHGCFRLPSVPFLGEVRACLPASAALCTGIRDTLGICTFWSANEALCTDLCSACGNGIVEPAKGEQCDDGNATNGDGCDISCQFEPLYCCFNGARSAINAAERGRVPAGPYTGIDCNLLEGGDVGSRDLTDETELDRSIPCGCGDGIVDTLEECDLGRASDGANRNTEEYGCDACELVCGNSVIDTDSYVVDWYNLTDWAYGGPRGIYLEVCDDGNVVNNDACDNYCQTCGNNQIDPGEKCDLGRSETDGGSLNIPEYGCSDDCASWTCSNGILEPDAFVVNDAGTDWEYDADGGAILQEQCDDGNVNQDDGCDRFCQEEPGICCDVGGPYATPNQILTRSACDNGDGTFNAVSDINAKSGFENIVVPDLQFAANNDVAESFCAVDAGDKYCCDSTDPFDPVKLDRGNYASCADATVNNDVLGIGVPMNLATAKKACAPVYCEDKNCALEPKFNCTIGYGKDWVPPTNSEHKAAMQSLGKPFNAQGFCEYWTTPGI